MCSSETLDDEVNLVKSTENNQNCILMRWKAFAISCNPLPKIDKFAQKQEWAMSSGWKLGNEFCKHRNPVGLENVKAC
ncbi:hypothetical protein ACOSQ2_001312 [Xanthoceras sorbifolium]